MKKRTISLMLDSGAFSSWTKGTDIDLDIYIDFCLKYLPHLDYIVNLDVIPGRPGWKDIPIKEREKAASQGWKNYKYMIKQGIPKEKLIHVFHQGDDFKWLEKIIKEMDYIGLSPANDRSTKDKSIWLDQCMSFVTDKEGIPFVKFHGFAVTSLRLMTRYPWYSVDSSSWAITSRMGSVYVPRHKQGKWIYNEDAWKVAVSTKSSAITEEGKHLSSFPPSVRKIILKYFKSRGYPLGKSDGFDKEGKEIIIEPGLCNDYKMRDELNILYFLDLEENLPKWPWAFKKKERGFEI